jgi:O-antigen/teichoic acid export membrane protein
VSSNDESGEGEGALAGTAFALLAQLTTAVFTAVVTLYLVRALGPNRYGALALVLSVAGIAVVLADAALAQSASRYIAVRGTDRGWVAAVLGASIRLKLGVATVVCAALVALAGPIAGAYHAPQMAWPLRLAALSVLGESVMMLWATAFQALRRVALVVRLFFLESAVEAAATIGLVAAGGGVAGAVLGRGVGYLFGAVVGAALITRRFTIRLRVRDVDAGVRRQVSRYARPLLLNTSAYTLYTQIDVQLIGMLLTRAAVGVFAAPFKIIILLCYPGQSVANAVSPRMSGDTPDVTAFTTATRWLLVYQTALIPLVVVWSRPVTVALLGHQFADSAAVLAALAPYLFLRGVSTLASTTVNYLGHARRRIPIVVASLVVNIVIDLVLLPTVGILGAAVGIGVSYAVYVPLHLRICHESFGLPLGALARTLAKCAVAAVAAGLVLFAFGTRDVGISDGLVGGAAGLAAYVGVLFALRELTGSDAQEVVHAGRALGRRMRRRRPELRRPALRLP